MRAPLPLILLTPPVTHASSTRAQTGVARFAPTTLCHKPVRSTGVITYNFVIPTR